MQNITTSKFAPGNPYKNIFVTLINTAIINMFDVVLGMKKKMAKLILSRQILIIVSEHFYTSDSIFH